MSAYDLIVIGTGPGGYVCAIRASQLGLKVGVVEKRATHGGTCLNVGCIPSKALLHASELYDEARHAFSAMGIEAATELNLAQMMTFKDEGVKGNVDGVAFLLRKNKIDHFHGTGRVLGGGKVEVTFINGETQMIETKAAVIATGSEPAQLPGHRDRREGRRLIDRRAVARQGAKAAPRHRRRHHRAGAWLRVAAARVRGHGRRVPRPHPAGDSTARWPSRCRGS